MWYKNYANASQCYVIRTLLYFPPCFGDTKREIQELGICGFLIQRDQKVSVHLTIRVHHQVHRDFLITLYNDSTLMGHALRNS
jgi:hypothetical protein